MALLIAGCTDGGELDVDSMNVRYDGNESGNHEAKGTCDTDGQLTGSGKVEDGRLRVTIRDGEGETVFERTYDADIEFQSQSINGSKGDWTLRAERMGDDLVGDEFKGRYEFTLLC